MCGIHGIFRFDGGRVEPAELTMMGNVTTHRGPDDEGQYIAGACGIAMRRLSIIDLAGGHQPISSADESSWIVCNGEIYNYRELRNELVALGYAFKTASDIEVMLNAYDAWGDRFLDRLNGMFAFALWDGRRQRLVLGRDRLGIKPLYIYQDEQRLAFASEAKALLALPWVKAELNHAALPSYLHLGYVAAPHSMFRGIRKLPPATVLTIEKGQLAERRYWRVSGAVDTARSEADWIDLVRARMEESVRMQMVSDVPIGAFLSGGVDSSAVVGFMARHSAEPIRTYSIAFEGGTAERLYNELPYARRVAELFGTQHKEIFVKPDVVSLLPELIWHMDEPLSDTAFITTYLVSEFARRDVKVILSGVGGDELFGGYRRYLGGRYVERFQQVPRWARRAASNVARSLPSDRHSGMLNTMRLAKGFLASVEMTPNDRYRSYLQVFARQDANALLLGDRAAADDPLDAAFATACDGDELNRMLAVDAETQLPDDLLMLTDKMSMAVSLECRVPLLDHELVELAAAMPSAIKVRGGALKYLMKAALGELLPQDILNRKKRGFGTPMGAWLKRELAPVLRHVLDPRTIRERELFDPAAISALIRAHEDNRTDGTDPLLALMTLEIWSRMYLDRREPADVAAELKTYIQ